MKKLLPILMTRYSEIRTIYLILGTVFMVFLLSSCEKPCSCSQAWVNDCSLIYYPGDQVSHNGKCYKARAQGRACSCEPGTPQDDIWDECR